METDEPVTHPTTGAESHIMTKEAADGKVGVHKGKDVANMTFTKQHGIATLRVAILDPKLVPDVVEVVIGEHVYALQFRVEKADVANAPQPIDMDFDPSIDGDKGNPDTQQDEKNKEDKLGETEDSSVDNNSTSEAIKMNKQAPMVMLTPCPDGTQWTASTMPTSAMQVDSPLSNEKKLQYYQF